MSECDVSFGLQVHSVHRSTPYTHQVETQEVEDLPGVVLLQNLFEGVLDKPGQ